MAAGSSKGSRDIANLGKRVVNHILNFKRDPSEIAVAIAVPSHRSVHTSAYEKNVEAEVRHSLVPDDVVEPQSENYWAPNPQTGVFGPANDAAEPAGGERPANANAPPEPVLEETAWFRPTSLQDLEKPHPHN